MLNVFIFDYILMFGHEIVLSLQFDKIMIIFKDFLGIGCWELFIFCTGKNCFIPV